ncbi:DUF6054 family protein [Lachnospiraceae bacterium 46-61]
MYNDIYITLSPEEGAELLRQWVEERGNFIRKIGKNIIDSYVVHFGENKKAIIIVIEYFTWRNNNQMTATVTLDNTTKYTKVHTVTGGSSQGIIFTFDYGARESLETNLKSIFKPYEVKEIR